MVALRREGRGRTAQRADYVYPAAHKIGGKSRQATVIAARPAKFDHDILAVGEAALSQAATKRFEEMRRVLWRP